MSLLEQRDAPSAAAGARRWEAARLKRGQLEAKWMALGRILAGADLPAMVRLRCKRASCLDGGCAAGSFLKR